MPNQSLHLTFGRDGQNEGEFHRWTNKKMKTRESGMPDEEMWQAFFKPIETLRTLGLEKHMSHVVDFGCGYGTFTIPAAQLIAGTVHAFDIEPEMIEETKRKAERAALTNIKFYLRDFITDGTGLPEASVDYVMLYNILHAEDPTRLLSESFRILREGGTVGIMHFILKKKERRSNQALEFTFLPAAGKNETEA